MKNRAYRRAQKSRVIKKRLKLVKARDNRRPDMSGKTYYEKVAEKANVLDKNHPYDCGNAKCMICHAEKILRKKKARERKLAIKVKQQLKEDLE
jgi:hypothetical protein